MAGDTADTMLAGGAPALDRRRRLAALPLLAVAVGVSLISALSGGPLDALAGLPMLVLSAVLLLGGSAGVETLVRLAGASGDHLGGATPVRRRFRLFARHAPALRLLVAGRPLRGPPAGLTA